MRFIGQYWPSIIVVALVLLIGIPIWVKVSRRADRSVFQTGSGYDRQAGRCKIEYGPHGSVTVHKRQGDGIVYGSGSVKRDGVFYPTDKKHKR